MICFFRTAKKMPEGILIKKIDIITDAFLFCFTINY